MLSVILAFAGLISYGIIWYRNKKSGSTPEIKTDASATPIVNVYQPVSTLPKVQSYAWWINKIGRSSFPLGMSSVGVEVVKVQEVLNSLSIAKKLGASALEVDGKWGINTDTRFKTLFPGFNQVSQYLFISEFDKNAEILK